MYLSSPIHSAPFKHTQTQSQATWLPKPLTRFVWEPDISTRGCLRGASFQKTLVPFPSMEWNQIHLEWTFLILEKVPYLHLWELVSGMNVNVRGHQKILLSCGWFPRTTSKLCVVVMVTRYVYIYKSRTDYIYSQAFIWAPGSSVVRKGPMKVHRCISVYPSCVSTVADYSCQLVPMHHLSCKIVIIISGVVTSFSGFSTPEREDVYTRGESGVLLMWPWCTLMLL